jgi:hypothetical protein
MVAFGKVSWRMSGGGVSLPLRWLGVGEHRDRAARLAPAVVFVHGLLGNPTMFVILRHALGGHPP